MKFEAALQMLDFENFAVWCGNFNPQNKVNFRCFMITLIYSLELDQLDLA